MGAGVIGVTTAYYLAKAGHAVTVLERQPGVGLETTFANGGQISAEHVEPWANPAAIGVALRSIGRIDGAMAFRPRLDWAQWGWGLRFLRNCTAARARANGERNLILSLYSRDRLIALRATTGIAYHHLDRGVLAIFRDPRELRAAAAGIDWLNAHGCAAERLDADGCVELEPALEACRHELAGGIASRRDESGDAFAFTERLAELCAAMGVEFCNQVTVLGVAARGLTVTGVHSSVGELRADAYVMALGSFSRGFLKPLDIDVPIYPVKGYSVTIPTAGHNGAPTVSITDADRKLVFTRLGDNLRVAGTAELTGYDTTVDRRRAGAILEATMRQFPAAGDAEKAQFWAGLRPMTPDGVPVVGFSQYDNLFLNTGHGTYGWTMSCGSGQVIADIVSGKQPEIDIEPFGLERFA